MAEPTYEKLLTNWHKCVDPDPVAFCSDCSGFQYMWSFQTSEAADCHSAAYPRHRIVRKEADHAR